MSYILEALKKADKKRKLGETPDLHTVHEPALENPEERPRWPYLLALALLVNAGLIAWWLKPWNPELPPPETAVTEAPAQPPAELEEPARPTVVEEVGEEVRSPVESEAVDSFPEVIEEVVEEVGEEVEEKRVVGTPPPMMPPPLAVGQVGGPPIPPQAAATPVPALPVMPKTPALSVSEAESPAADEDPFFAEEVGDEMVEEAPTALAEALAGRLITPDPNKSLEESVEPQEELFDIDRIPYTYQLPMALQQGLPEIKISFHSFTHRPTGRLVSLNGRIMREGQDFSTKLKLDRIVATGVVMLVKEKEKRFRIDI